MLQGCVAGECRVAGGWAAAPARTTLYTTIAEARRDPSGHAGLGRPIR